MTYLVKNLIQTRNVSYFLANNRVCDSVENPHFLSQWLDTRENHKIQNKFEKE
jgi:hypothetical protein